VHGVVCTKKENEENIEVTSGKWCLSGLNYTEFGKDCWHEVKPTSEGSHRPNFRAYQLQLEVASEKID
jgi:hypothetical protein